MPANGDHHVDTNIDRYNIGDGRVAADHRSQHTFAGLEQGQCSSESLVRARLYRNDHATWTVVVIDPALDETVQHESKLRATHYCDWFTPCRSNNRWSDDCQGKVLRLLRDDVFRQCLGKRVRVRSITNDFARQNVEDLIVHPFARIEQFGWLNGWRIDHLCHIASIAIGIRSRNMHNGLKSTA